MAGAFFPRDEYFMRLAIREAERALEHDDVPIGAVVVAAGEVIGAGRNERELRQDPTAHAEMLALREAARHVGSWRVLESVLYVTLEPCAMCAGAIVLGRVARVVYGTADPKAGAAGSVLDVLGERRLNHRPEVAGGLLRGGVRRAAGRLLLLPPLTRHAGPMSATQNPAGAVLPATLRLGPVHLTVADLDRSSAFYQDSLGLRVHRREDPVAALGAGADDLVVLHEEPGAGPAGRHAGLFHFALLYPSREELARAVQRLAATRIAAHGRVRPRRLGGDLPVRPRRQRDRALRRPPARGVAAALRRGERVGMFTRPLDLEALLATAAGAEPPRHAGAGLRMGHVHLHVGDIAAASAFYADVLGFELMATYPGALFLAAGGYHHHLGVNTWAGEGVGPAPPATVGLREWTIVLDADSLAALRARVTAAGVGDGDGDVLADPWGIRVRAQLG